MDDTMADADERLRAETGLNETEHSRQKISELRRGVLWPMPINHDGAVGPMRDKAGRGPHAFDFAAQRGRFVIG
jgi:hypothetical protein